MSFTGIQEMFLRLCFRMILTRHCWPLLVPCRISLFFQAKDRPGQSTLKEFPRSIVPI